jgi:hypothetical protein
MVWSCVWVSSWFLSVGAMSALPADDEPITADAAAARERGESVVVAVEEAPPPSKPLVRVTPPAVRKPARQPALVATTVWPVVPSLQLGLAVSDQGVFPVAVVDAFVPIIPTIGPWVRVAAGGTAGSYGLLAGELMAGVGAGVEGQLGGVHGRAGVMPVVGLHAYRVVGSSPLPGTPPSPVPLLGLWAPIEVELPLGGGIHAIVGATLGYTNAVAHRINGEDAFGRGRLYALMTFGLLLGGAP